MLGRGVPTGDASLGTAFDVFYRDNQATTDRLCRLLTGAPPAAEDLAHDAFVRVHRHFARLDHPVAYLRTVTVNVCRNWHRHRGREAARLIRLARLDETTELHADELGPIVVDSILTVTAELDAT